MPRRYPIGRHRAGNVTPASILRDQRSLILEKNRRVDPRSGAISMRPFRFSTAPGPRGLHTNHFPCRQNRSVVGFGSGCFDPIIESLFLPIGGRLEGALRRDEAGCRLRRGCGGPSGKSKFKRLREGIFVNSISVVKVGYTP